MFKINGKKLILGIVACLALLTATAYAKIGDIAGEIYSTDILTQVDGRDIRGYAIDGETMIVLEDLREYGFTVYYNDNVRTLFVTKTGEPAPDFKPEIARGKVGRVEGHYYETDIVAYVNGVRVPTYALSGELAISVEEMVTMVGEHPVVYDYNYDGVYQNPVNVFEGKSIFSYTYDDSQRLLSLTTVPCKEITREAVAKAHLGVTTPWRAMGKHMLHNDEYTYISYSMGGIMGGPHKTRLVIMPNGISYNALELYRRYGLHSHMNEYTDIFNPVMSIDGKSLYMVHKYYGGEDYKQLEMESMHIKPLSAEEYDNARTYITKSDYTLTIDGISIPLYKAGGRDYVCAEDMRLAGFSVGYDEVTKFLTVLYTGKVDTEYTPSDFSEGNFEDVAGDVFLSLNGGFGSELGMGKYEGKHLLPVDLFTYDDCYTKNVGTIKYNYDIENKRIVATTVHDMAYTYSQDAYDTRLYFAYSEFGDEGARVDFDTKDEFSYRLIGKDSCVYLYIDESTIYPIKQQLWAYLHTKGYGEEDATYESFDGEVVKFKLKDGKSIGFSLRTFSFIE